MVKRSISPTELWEDFVSLVFPKICIHCGIPLVKQEDHICTKCRLSLPKTDYHTFIDNPLKSKFVYEPKIKSVAAYLHFNKKGLAQSLIHHLKYKGEKDIGETLGRWYGHDLLDCGWKLDLIIPVPLHVSKLRKRGFNQSEHFAIGLSETLEIPLDAQVVSRRVRTASQTRRSKVERWQNMESIYRVQTSMLLREKDVLVVDDVLTTGATIGELVSVLVDAGVRSVRILTIAAGK